jgi:hypothetical protein
METFSAITVTMYPFPKPYGFYLSLREENTMVTQSARGIRSVQAGIIAVLALLTIAPVGADDPGDHLWTCLVGQHVRIAKGFDISPVPLNLEGKHPALVGLGSYIVNAQGGCSDCHTNPPYAAGGDPFAGEPEQINTAGYLAGGTPFGPGLISPNLTPCDPGKPAGLDRDAFIQLMRTGIDPEDGERLQVMPWPVYGKMTGCELTAIHEFLKAIPPRDCTPAKAQ